MTPDEINVLCAEFMEAKPKIKPWIGDRGQHCIPAEAPLVWWQPEWLHFEDRFSDRGYEPRYDVTTDLNAGMEVNEKYLRSMAEKGRYPKLYLSQYWCDDGVVRTTATWEEFRPGPEYPFCAAVTPPEALARALGEVLGEGK